MISSRLFVINLAMKLFPSTRLFGLKRVLLRWAGVRLGENVRCASNSTILTGGLLSIGQETWIGHDVLIIGGDSPISIGSNCDIAPRVSLVSGSHRLNPQGPRVAGESYSQPIEIGNGCWIGAGATILGGSTIGERSVIAAGAVVKGSFPSACLIGGVPAKVIKHMLSAAE